MKKFAASGGTEREYLVCQKGAWDIFLQRAPLKKPGARLNEKVPLPTNSKPNPKSKRAEIGMLNGSKTPW